MKVAIVIDTWFGMTGGVVTSTRQIKKHLEIMGIEVVLIHPGLFFSIPVPYYHEVGLAFFSKRRMERMLKEERPDSIHIMTEFTLGLAARAICLKNKWKFTTSYHTRIPEYLEAWFNWKKNPAYTLLHWFHSKSQKILVSTDSLKRTLEERRFKNVVVCPLGVDTNFFKKNPHAKIVHGLKKPIFTFLGRTAAEKNIGAFLKCDLPGSKMVIGDGSYRKKLEKRFKGKALFTGYKTGQELVDLLSISDVFVFPSKTETFGLTMIEAMACGLPVAAFDIHGPNDIVTDGLDGYLGDDLESNAKKCLELNAENCRKTAMKYTWEECTSKFFENLVDK